MNVLAWLRKLVYASHPLGPRQSYIGVDALRSLTAAHLEKRGISSVESRQFLSNAIAVQEKRAEPGPRPDVLPGPGPAIRDEPLPRELTLVRRSAEAPERGQPTPFVGREAELRLLLRAWRRAEGGQGQVVLLSGEAGIGKSRIVRELCGRLTDRAHTALWHRCSPEHALSPFHPIIEQLRQTAALTQEHRSETQLTGADGIDGSDALGALIGDAHERAAQLKLTPQRLRQRTFDGLLTRCDRLARQQAILAIYEDLQWADPSTLEFLDRLVDRVRGLPMLALLSFRPEFAAAWPGRGDEVQLVLSRLARGPCQAMIDHLSAGRLLAEPLLEELIGRSDGVPLLVEEHTKTVLALADGVDHGALADAMPEDAFPSTLSEALAARLGPSRDAGELAQIGAVIGREFSHRLLAATADWPEDYLRAALDQLVASELLVPRGTPPDAAYEFRHALIRDAAYHSLPEHARRSLHSSIARLLEERSPDEAANAPELLAQHHAAAGHVRPAVAYCLRAGKRAVEQCAHGEAIALFSKGLGLLDTLPAGSEQASQRVELLAALARVLTVTEGNAAPEAKQACDLARTLCPRVGDSPELFPALRGMWDYYNTRGELEAACELAGQCHELAASAQDPCLLAEARFCLGVSSLFTGQLVEARDRLSLSVLRREAAPRAVVPRAELTPRIIALTHLAQVLWLCGYPEQAIRVSQEAAEAARAEGHPFSLTYALVGLSWMSQFLRDADGTRALATDAITAATEEGLPAFLAMATILREWTSIAGDAAERAAAAAAMRAALEDYRATGVEIARPYLLALLAEVSEAAAERDAALAALAEAAEVARSTGELWYEAEIRRQEGELLLRQSVTNRRLASACFCQAIAVAQQQGNRSLELRATMSLARLWSDLGRRAQARDLLAPAYAWFKEGLDTADLKDARALLDQLG
jgi:predicted ATPase